MFKRFDDLYADQEAKRFLSQGPWGSSSADPLNYYTVLGLPTFSSEEDIEKAYREQLKKYESEDVEESVEMRKVLHGAYEVLNSRQRCIHDLDLGLPMRKFMECSELWLVRDEERFQARKKAAREARERANGPN
ncbi:hypothetical protein F5Y11DRAFT_322831 [Daldinia sp. FL1419]|nr:hypothetical protein F5Y11DRAFT_322831 [Daldinia sp. FL1419]